MSNEMYGLIKNVFRFDLILFPELNRINFFFFVVLAKLYKIMTKHSVQVLLFSFIVIFSPDFFSYLFYYSIYYENIIY